MKGVQVVSRGSARLAVVLDFSDELAGHIEKHLADICYGSRKVREDAAHYSLRRAAAEFVRRYDAKPETTKIGMMGELLTHALAPVLYEDLVVASIFFNKEDRGIKKGFDLTFARPDWSAVWYSEVKSGGPSTGPPSRRARSLLRSAASDLLEKLTSQDRESTWEAAITDALLTITDPHSGSVRSLLRSDLHAAEAGDDWQRSAIVSAVVFHPVAESAIATADLATDLDSLSNSGDFHEIRAIVIQKSTIEKVVNFIRTQVGLST